MMLTKKPKTRPTTDPNETKPLALEDPSNNLAFGQTLF